MAIRSKPACIQFTGGPFDGHFEDISLRQDGLADALAVPINANVMAALEGWPRGSAAPATSVAVYELQWVDGNCRYGFLGSATCKQFGLENWLG